MRATPSLHAPNTHTRALRGTQATGHKTISKPNYAAETAYDAATSRADRRMEAAYKEAYRIYTEACEAADNVLNAEYAEAEATFRASRNAQKEQTQ